MRHFKARLLEWQFIKLADKDIMYAPMCVSIETLNDSIDNA